MDASKVLAVADEIEAAETEAMRDFAPRDGVDPIGAAYAAGMVDAIDGGWAKQLRAACGPDAASDASADPRDVAHMLDMAAPLRAKMRWSWTASTWSRCAAAATAEGSGSDD